MQAQLTNVLGLNNANARISLDSISSFAGSTNNKRAFKRLCKDLHQIGVTADAIRQNESEILNICKPQNAATSGGQSQLPAVSNFSSVKFLVILVHKNILNI